MLTDNLEMGICFIFLAISLVMRVPLLPTATGSPLSAAYFAMSKKPLRSNGSPPVRIINGFPISQMLLIREKHSWVDNSSLYGPYLAEARQ
jgi:hypothetical protein